MYLVVQFERDTSDRRLAAFEIAKGGLNVNDVWDALQIFPTFARQKGARSKALKDDLSG